MESQEFSLQPLQFVFEVYFDLTSYKKLRLDVSLIKPQFMFCNTL